MHLSLSPYFLNVFSCKVVCFFTISVTLVGITLADELASPSSSSLPSFKARNHWNLKHSDPTRDGKFLNVPIYYGDWVPINSAKAQIESLASSVGTSPNKNRRKDEKGVGSSTILTTDDLTSPVKSSFVVSEQRPHHAKQHQYHYPHTQVNEAEERVEIDHHHHHYPQFIGPRLPAQQNNNKETNIRHHSINRPFNRIRTHYRGGSGVGGNSRRKYRPTTNSDALTRLFGPSLGWNGNRRQHRKIAQPHHSQNSVPLVDQISSIFGPAPTQDTTVSQTTTSTGSVALDTLGTLFNHWPSLPNIKGSSRPDSQYGNQQTSETIFQPVVKLLPSPDLTQDGNTENHLIYEDDGKGGGDIIVGRRPDQNEIDGFRPVSSGQTIRADQYKTENDFRNPSSQYHKRPSNFSVLISGISKSIDVPSLAKLFKEGKIAEKGDHEAFIGSPDVSAPDGFHKITLPFMDPSHTSSDPSNLPSIFIAPLGYKAPKGYKGHPLPFDPAPIDPHYSSSSNNKINLVHTTEPSSLSDDVDQENEVKTTRFKNPFLRNKLRNQRLPYRPIKTTSTTEFSLLLDLTSKDTYTTEKTESSLAENEGQEPSNFVRSKIKFNRNRFKPQRKRVLTKIVRKPYTPSITTPSPTLDTKKIVRIVEPTSISLKVEEYFPPTSGRPVLGDRNEDKIDLVVDQDYNITSINPSLGISTTFRPIQIKYLDIQSTKKAITFYEPKTTHIVPDVTDNKEEIQFVEKENNIVDHFEPTTTHNNLIFDTTKPAEETTNSNVETDNKELYDDDELTTVAPTSFVTRNTFAPSVTNRPTTKIIQFLPYSPAATTRKTTSPTKTASQIVTDPNHSYEPTPFNFHLDPIARLERLNKLKNKKYRPSILDKEEELEYVIPTVRPTSSQQTDNASYKVHNNRIKYRKYGYNQGKDDGRIFGQRLKERKRPKLWDNGYVRDNFYATTTEAIENATAKKSKSEEYKRKFRPFFDQLYERLTNDKDKDNENPDGNNRRISVFSVRRKIRPYKGWRKKSRSTTTPNPFTINAEIYEVHPESRARITTTTTSTPPPTFETVTESSTLYQDYTNELEDEDYTPNRLVNKDEAAKNYEQTESRADEQDNYKDENDVHETADKHSPVHHDYGLEETSFGIQHPKSSSILIPFQDQTQFKPSLQETNEFSHNGLVDSNVALEFGESQFVESSLNQIVASSPESSAAPATRLLDQYQKTFKPSSQIANEHDSSYQEPNGIINEHSQQKLTVKEGDFIPFHSIREGDHWEPRPLVPYVEIQRVTSENKAPLSISVETVPTDDTSLIQEVLEEVYNITAPVDIGSNSQNEIYHKPLPDYTSDYGENEDYEVSTGTKVSVATNNEPIVTTAFWASKETDDEDVTTTKPNVESENIESGDTTISFFVTPTTQSTNTHQDEILADPGPTIQESSLIIENGDLDESTTDFGSTLKGKSSYETTSTEAHTKLTEEATPERSDETEDDNYTTISADKDATTSITTASATTLVDNFEVTTFRPKGNGGFFENFNLANLLSYIVPKRTTTTTTTTPLPTTTIPTTKTTEEESKPVTEITTTGFTDAKSETVTKSSVKFTTQKLSDQDVVSTDLPSTVPSEETTEEQTTLLQNEEYNDITKSVGTTTSPDTTKIFASEVPVQDKTTVQQIVNVPHLAVETTTEQEEIDTTTTADIVFKTTTSKSDETTRYSYAYEDDKTTVPNYITTTLTNRIRTDRPFRGPLRIHKTFKKHGNRYQLKNKNKKFSSGLLKRLDDKNKKDSTISKAVYGAIKREEFIKNWVARKYNKLENNSKKRLFSLNTTYEPQTTIGPSQETTPEEITSESQTSLASTVITSTTKNRALPFAPTALPPKNKLFHVDLDTTIREGSSTSSVGKTSSINTVSPVKSVISEKRKTFLDKLKSTARKSLSDNLFAKSVKSGKNSETSSSSISLPTHKSSKKISWVYPRGSNTNVFKKWGGNSLSQAEFERQVLGVSTATEVSVKSMICVRGRCYNADDKSLANK